MYASPYSMTPTSGPRLLFPPHIQYCLLDIGSSSPNMLPTEEVDIVMRSDQLLCLELYTLADDVQPKPPAVMKGDPFDRVKLNDRQLGLFQGAVGFETLATAWLARKPATNIPASSPFAEDSPVPVGMNGPGGRGRAEVLVWTEQRRSVIDRLWGNSPGQISARLSHITIHKEAFTLV